MTSLNQHSQKSSQQPFPILSLNKFARQIGVPREKIEELADKTLICYDPFSKKTGGKERIIDRPIGLLKEIQKRIHDRILSSIDFPEFIIGGVKGRKPSEHPQRHINKRVVITLDVKDCFPSITNKQIFDVWHKQLRCSSEVARLATKLTTVNGHLPLGAPTSDSLSNLALKPCLDRVVEIAKQYGFSSESIGQYIDDSAFSGNVLPENFISSVVKEFSRHSFKIKRSKIKIMWSNEKQVVTKKIVNKKVSIPLAERDKVRAALNELIKTDPKELMYTKRYRSLKGRINNLQEFHANLAKKLWEQFNHLKKPHKSV